MATVALSRTPLNAGNNGSDYNSVTHHNIVSEDLARTLDLFTSTNVPTDLGILFSLKHLVSFSISTVDKRFHSAALDHTFPRTCVMCIRVLR